MHAKEGERWHRVTEQEDVKLEVTEENGLRRGAVAPPGPGDGDPAAPAISAVQWLNVPEDRFHKLSAAGSP